MSSSRRSHELAQSHALAGENDAAFGELELAYSTRNSTLITMYVDPRLDNLRGDPRFDGLARRIGLPQVKSPVTMSGSGPQ